MNTKINNLLMPTAAAVSLLLLGSCVEDDEPAAAAVDTPADNADLLIGDWELVSVDGENYDIDNDTTSYSLILKFESDGDFGFCYDYENKLDPSENDFYCSEGGWEWITKGEELTFSFEDESEDEDGNVVTIDAEVNLKITKLTATELEGDWTSEGENETYEVVLKKN